MNYTSRIALSALATLGTLVIAACGGSGGNQTGNLTIGLTDGPVEGAESVVVEVAGIEVRSAGNSPETYEIADGCDGDLVDGDGICSIDLLSLQGQNRAVLFSEDVAAGTYQQIRLLVNAQPNTIDSYLVPEGNTAQCSIWIPSSGQVGLRLISNITVAANGVTDFTLDFDVRKSITNPPGLAGMPATSNCVEEYVMRPVLRIIDTGNVGSIAGTVDSSLLDSCDQDATTMEYLNTAVYVFWEDGAAPPAADDIDMDVEGMATGDAADPVTTATVSFDSQLPGYVYEAGYLLAGETYRVALTCDADADEPGTSEFDPEVPDANPDFRFLAERDDVTVSVNSQSDGSLTTGDAI